LVIIARVSAGVEEDCAPSGASVSVIPVLVGMAQYCHDQYATVSGACGRRLPIRTWPCDGSNIDTSAKMQAEMLQQDTRKARLQIMVPPVPGQQRRDSLSQVTDHTTHPSGKSSCMGNFAQIDDLPDLGKLPV
jgi:hypothetical protein